MKKYDVVGIGSPILDFIYEIEDYMLEEFGLRKGEMKSISTIESQKIFNRLNKYIPEIAPGGSAANVAAGVCCLGGKSAFFGKLGNDKYAEIYIKKTKEHGVEAFFSKNKDEITGHAITLITPDFERTFAVNLGAAILFDKNDLSEDILLQSKILHIEGFQLEDIQLRETALSAMAFAKQNNVLVSLDLSDPALIKRNLLTLKDIVRENVDILFANEVEANSFTKKSPEEAVIEMEKICKIAIVKIGEKGSLIRKDNKTFKISPRKVNVVNTNGAGDMYAAGILFGISNNLDIEKSGNLASYVSSLVVEVKSARIEKSLKEDIKKLI